MLANGILGAVAGFAAGGLGRVALNRALTPARPPKLCCEGGTALLWAVSASTGPPWWWAPIPLLLAWLTVLLTVSDLRTARLPNALTLPAYPATAALLAVAARYRPGLLPAALGGAALFAGTYLLVRLISPRAMGPGDVKLACPLGAMVGAASLPAVPVVMVVAAVATLFSALVRRSGTVPHGPAMLIPSWLVTALCNGAHPGAPG